MLAHAEPLAVTLIAAVGAPAGLLVLGSRAGALDPARASSRDRWSYGAGVAVVALAASPPIHSLGEDSITGHMVQHLLFIIVAAPLLGGPLVRARRRVRGTRRGLGRQLRRVAWHPAGPLLAAAVGVVVVGGWHVPALYDAALESWPVHLFEHVTFLGVSVWLFAAVAHHGRRRGALSCVAALFATATAGAGVGVLMMFAPRTLYAHGTIEDQQVAGVLMASGMGVAYVGLAMSVLVRLVDRHVAAAGGGAPVGPAPVAGEPGPARPGSVARPAGRVARSGSVLPVVALVLGPVGLAVAATAATVAATVPTTAEASVGPTSSGDLARGRELYGRDCASCHGIDAGGTDRGTSLDGFGAAGIDYVLTTGRMPIATPDDPIERGRSHYDDADVAALVAYTATLITGPAVPEVDPDAGDLAGGGVLYRLHCVQCHSATGIGGALARGELAPPLWSATPTQVAEAVVVGPGTMPSFDVSFDDGDLDDLVAYVAYLQDPPRQGVPVPGGRVGEGLVAWVAGFGVLVVGALLVGVRSRWPRGAHAGSHGR